MMQEGKNRMRAETVHLMMLSRQPEQMTSVLLQDIGAS